MKATCISACEIAGMGIIRPGEEIELDDGFFNDERIRMHFTIAESTVKDRNAKAPDLMAELDGRRRRFADSLVDHTKRIVALNRIVDSGMELPRELADPTGEDAPTEGEQIAKIVELWCDAFGYEFPTDGERGTGNGERETEKPQKKPGKGKKEKPPEGEKPGEGGEPPDGTGASEAQGGAADAQQSLFDKLNGKS